MSLFKLFRSKSKAKFPASSKCPSGTSSPPPYSPVDLAGRSTFAVAGLEKLREYDTIFLVDDSSSMSTDAPSGQTRWREACNALADFADVAIKHDEDGIDIHFINKSVSGLGVKGTDETRKLFSFSPCGRTDIGAKLKALLPPDYVTKMEAASKELGPWPKRLSYIIITDGEATDPEVLRSWLKDLAQKLCDIHAPQAQIGFQFVQVGDDERASRFLDELDGDGGFKIATDIVDTVKFHPGQRFDALFLTKALMGGINRRLDYKG
ncbi:hypothetical protein BKA70DRAFT_1419649 [Coprinopsis sp. MPI-PUGE-AT-0042]|nr:hypothetical protein BKA70DRAFT_1419649 [Coprinopsis sp. MPI-PUGE-AT-0042]